ALSTHGRHVDAAPPLGLELLGAGMAGWPLARAAGRRRGPGAAHVGQDLPHWAPDVRKDAHAPRDRPLGGEGLRAGKLVARRPSRVANCLDSWQPGEWSGPQETAWSWPRLFATII